jgi:hypothetical protein
LEKKQGIELFLEIGGELNMKEYKLGVQEGKWRRISRLVRLECMNLFCFNIVECEVN